MEAKETRLETLKFTGKGLGYTTLASIVPIGLISGFAFFNSSGTEITFMDSLRAVLYNLTCSDNIKFKEYTCDPYFIIPLLLALSLIYLGFCYTVGKNLALERYRNTSVYPPYRIFTAKTEERKQSEVNYKKATGETIPLSKCFN